MDIKYFLQPHRAIPSALALALFSTGSAGLLNEGWGYGPLLIATIALFFSLCAAGTFAMTRYFDTENLKQTVFGLLKFGCWSYVLGVAALSGFFVNETLHGRMEMKWILFGPTVLAAVIVLDLGVYRLLIKKNLPTWERFGHLVSREAINPKSMRRVLVDDVILHRSLLSASGFRWFKHTLIFWGFSLMFATEISAVFVREGLPAFGMADIWEVPEHPLRLAYDFAYDFTGLMVLVGCLLALGWRLKVNGTPEQQFSDTPTALFLFFVTISGFFLEGARIAGSEGAASHAASFVGLVFAELFYGKPEIYEKIYEPLWSVHVFGSCAFIAYVPIKRLVHSCATPLGRLMNSQTEILQAKKIESLKGMLIGKSSD